jgi:hypothetical protein
MTDERARNPTKRLQRIPEKFLSLRTLKQVIAPEIGISKPDRVLLDSACYPETKAFTG